MEYNITEWKYLTVKYCLKKKFRINFKILKQKVTCLGNSKALEILLLQITLLGKTQDWTLKECTR